MKTRGARKDRRRKPTTKEAEKTNTMRKEKDKPRSVIHIHDRTWTTTNARETFQRVDVWHDWSGRVGLKEHKKKLRVVARGAKAERDPK